MLVANSLKILKWPIIWRARAVPQTLLYDEKMGHQLLRDGAPNEALLKSVTAVNTMLAAKLRSTIFVREALLRPDTSVVRKTIAKCYYPTVECWMRMMSGTYPVNAYPYTIKKVGRPSAHSAIVGTEKQYLTFSKNAPTAPKFHHARTAQSSEASPVQIAPETRLSRLETCRRNFYVSDRSSFSRSTYSRVQQARRAVQDSQIQKGQMSLGR